MDESIEKSLAGLKERRKGFPKVSYLYNTSRDKSNEGVRGTGRRH